VGCCGQKRASLSSGIAAFSPSQKSVAARPAAPASRPAPAGPPAPVPARPTTVPSSGSREIEYRERSRVRVRGPATGRTYEFSGADPVQSVDRRDAPALLATRFFKPASAQRHR
jgi:hypothetical protein